MIFILFQVSVCCGVYVVLARHAEPIMFNPTVSHVLLIRHEMYDY